MLILLLTLQNVERVLISRLKCIAIAVFVSLTASIAPIISTLVTKS